MELYLAADGGGSKTKLALYDASGRKRGAVTAGPSAYCDMGVDAAAAVLREGLEALLKQANAALSDLKHAAFCLSSVGERPSVDEQLTRALTQLCGSAVVMNDSFGALYAAHGGKPGIAVVSGTGSIACGLDGEGGTARCGGYAPLFSDEGSAYWLGRLAMGLYTKQDDGRIEKGALHEVFSQRLGVRSAFELMEWAEHAHRGGRSRIAKLQLLLEAAAERGDTSAAALYERAAGELSLLVSGVRNRLHFSPGPVSVSCAGGTFRIGARLLEPLKKNLEPQGCALVPPLFDEPVKGAAILCLSTAGVAVTEATFSALRGE